MLGGIAKISIKRAASNDYFFDTSSEMVSFLSTKFVDKVLYNFWEIDVQTLEEARAEETL